ncbi:MAG TPA: hypothetical protein DCZ95_13890 [Verrucomicrobia bacterium]|nr:MAG: hypothetical protein A2X46_01985 [Lentisphaerae bacterium GWF2_57_35]HBA85175.1 hypothetical protein [Verrucomicrobiota bacterium]
MVKGLQLFVEYFKNWKESYVLIGGAACDLWMGSQGLSFRATKDLDLVLIVEALKPEFFKLFWAFIREGQYKSHQHTETRPGFYRFKNPAISDYPYMIELLTRNQLRMPESVHLTPLPAGENVSSLSAILLDETYYRFIVDSRILLSGIPIIPAYALIPLKARAWLDLTERRTRGDPQVKGDDIKKHRHDIFRLYLTLAPSDRFDLPMLLRQDLAQFLGHLPPDSSDWNSIRKAVQDAALPGPEEIIQQFGRMFGLDSKSGSQDAVKIG